ncbi:hypothetical protein BT96DRAFT_924442 [Gymnopus androsaceus JB14]|uniref:Uncharacterized protein n=1 Tax=Gymnopus androsaceus JB14 TaxID=1447944 RepID=A0A6A4H5B3_9AGAR|nr:hypothetical protein BT96DRAFT_924442 [Gymnopus androsaceus JB14]
MSSPSLGFGSGSGFGFGIAIAIATSKPSYPRSSFKSISSGCVPFNTSPVCVAAFGDPIPAISPSRRLASA